MCQQHPQCLALINVFNDQTSRGRPGHRSFTTGEERHWGDVTQVSRPRGQRRGRAQTPLRAGTSGAGDAAIERGQPGRGPQLARARRQRGPTPAHHSSPFNSNFLPLLWTPAHTHWLRHIRLDPPSPPAYWSPPASIPIQALRLARDLVNQVKRRRRSQERRASLASLAALLPAPTGDSDRSQG